MAEHDVPEREPDSRVPFALAAAILAAGGSVFVLGILCRCFVPLEWLADTRTRAWLALAVFVVVLVDGIRAGPKLRPAWILVAFVLVPATGFMAMVGEMFLHVFLSGTPVVDCDSELSHEETCRGRAWTFGQGHQDFWSATGTLRREACTTFTSGVAPSLEQRRAPRVSGGLVHCTLAEPRSWAEVACADVGFADCARCFECSGETPAGQHEIQFTLATDSQCERAAFTTTLNMSPAEAARYLAGVR
jgi:hypothetical protein